MTVDNKIFLYGASGHAKVVIDTLRCRGLRPFALLDDDDTITELMNVPVFQDQMNAGIQQSDLGIVTIGDNQTRKEIVRKLHGFRFGNAIHPSAVVSDTASIAEGTVVMANVSINVASSIGAHCIINTNASVDHECVVEDFVHISPNVSLAGNVKVGVGTHIGIGATVIQNIRIGNWVTIGGGAVIIRDVPDYAVVVGNPGRIIRFQVPVDGNKVVQK